MPLKWLFGTDNVHVLQQGICPQKNLSQIYRYYNYVKVSAKFRIQRLKRNTTVLSVIDTRLSRGSRSWRNKTRAILTNAAEIRFLWEALKSANPFFFIVLAILVIYRTNFNVLLTSCMSLVHGCLPKRNSLIV